MCETTNPPIYQIEIAGELKPEWINWMDGLSVALLSDTHQTGQPAITILSGPIVDQARLRGILNHLWDLNLTILGVRRLSCHPS